MNPQDGLGDRLKGYEASFERVAMKGIPLVARLDGRAFHTFTRSMKRPYDTRFQACMQAAATALIEDLHPNVAYTQSDEITIAWNIAASSKSDYPFGGRIQKLASVLASIATEAFNRAHHEFFDLDFGMTGGATFDCRVFQVPSTDELLDVFIWREDDAVKNSVTMLAQAHYSHKELHGQGTKDKLLMLEKKGVVWGNEPDHFKHGIFLKRRTALREMTKGELERVPEKYRAGLVNKLVERSYVGTIPVSRLRTYERDHLLYKLGLEPKE